MRKRVSWALAISCALAIGCQRSPEDLEAWRNAEGGYEKMAEWAKSSEEPMEVRVRAVQILIEEDQPNSLQPTLEGIEDEETRAKLAEGALPTVEKMWNAKDWPTVDEKEAKSGLVKVGASKSVTAKDAAYFLQPHARGEAKTKYEEILAQWMSQDQDIRTQLGSTTIGQIAPRAGDKGVERMMAWMQTTKRPAVVARNVREGADGNEEVLAKLATVIRERAEKEHPELSPEMEVAVLETEHEAIVPYLEKVIRDENSPPKLIDGAMDSLVKIQEIKATPLFAELVTNRGGLMRWVSAQRLIELRGKAGILLAAKALPLEADAYLNNEEHNLKKESETLCNFVDTEMKKQGLDSYSDVLQKGFESERWPVKVLALRCAQISKDASVKAQVEALSRDRTRIPAWHPEERKTLGELAREVAASL